MSTVSRPFSDVFAGDLQWLAGLFFVTLLLAWQTFQFWKKHHKTENKSDLLHMHLMRDVTLAVCAVTIWKLVEFATAFIKWAVGPTGVETTYLNKRLARLMGDRSDLYAIFFLCTAYLTGKTLGMMRLAPKQRTTIETVGLRLLQITTLITLTWTCWLFLQTLAIIADWFGDWILLGVKALRFASLRAAR